MDSGGLLPPSQHNTRPAMRLQITRERADPSIFSKTVSARTCTELRRDCAREVLDIRPAHRQAMVRLAAGGRGTALDHVQAIHLFAVLGFATLRKCERVSQESRVLRRCQEI